MPLLDVSEVLDDPMFQDTATLIRTGSQVNAFGEAELFETCIPISGVFIQGYAMPGGDGGLVRTPEGELNSNGLTIVTRVPVQMGDAASGTTADIIEMKGTRYVIIAQNDYSNFGDGFYYCLADQLPFNP